MKPSPSSAASPLPEAVLNALQRGQPVDAIRELRRAWGLGLREARQIVDAEATHLGSGRHADPSAMDGWRQRGAPQGLAPGEQPPHAGRLGWQLALAAIAALLLWRHFG